MAPHQSARGTGTRDTFEGHDFSLPVNVPPQDFRCTACGYGASGKIAPARCPMCSGSTWHHEARRRAPAHASAHHATLPLARDDS